MNAAAFRSHLMQQFVAASRNQARTPPIALVGWVGGSEYNSSSGEDEPRSAASDGGGTSTRQLSSIGTTAAASPSYTSLLQYSKGSDDTKKCALNNMRSLSMLTSTTPNDNDDEEDERKVLLAEDRSQPNKDSDATKQAPTNNINQAQLFQTLLQTRRTTSRFLKPSAGGGGSADQLLWTTDQYRQAIDRAVVAGRAAPNHKRTEPFSFKRLLGPSESTERLAEIASQVYLHTNAAKQIPKTALEDAAQRKRNKWSEIPAYLVTLVSTAGSPPAEEPSPNPSSGEVEVDPLSVYEPYPYIPPHTERELEDYAAACAATQNILLSLHAEHLACKWATGPVIHTPAFRQLVQAQDKDRVVGLIMIGQAAKETNRPRRYRRALHGDVLQDL